MIDVIKLYITIAIYNGSIKSKYENTIVSEDNSIILDCIKTITNEVTRVKNIAYSDDIVKTNKRLLRDIFNFHIAEGITENISNSDDFIDSIAYNIMCDKIFEYEFIYMWF